MAPIERVSRQLLRPGCPRQPQMFSKVWETLHPGSLQCLIVPNFGSGSSVIANSTRAREIGSSQSEFDLIMSIEIQADVNSTAEWLSYLFEVTWWRFLKDRIGSRNHDGNDYGKIRRRSEQRLFLTLSGISNQQQSTLPQMPTKCLSDSMTSVGLMIHELDLY
jgi:hypothetical protein